MLLVYRNPINFIMLSCILQTLETHLLVVVLFFLDSLGFSTYEILSCVNKDSFTSFFSTCMSSYLPISLEHPIRCRLQMVMSGYHFCFHSKRKICQPDIISMMLTGQMSHIFFKRLRELCSLSNLFEFL